MQQDLQRVDVAAGRIGPAVAPLPDVAQTPARRTLKQECRRCGRGFEHGFTPRCPTCTGPVEVVYDLSAVKLRDAPVTSQRFADLLKDGPRPAAELTARLV